MLTVVSLQVCGLHPSKCIHWRRCARSSSVLGTLVSGYMLQFRPTPPCRGIVPSTLRDRADRQSPQLRAVGCRRLPLRRLSLSRLLCKAIMPVYGWRRSLFSGVRVFPSELPGCLVDMCPTRAVSRVGWHLMDSVLR